MKKKIYISHRTISLFFSAIGIFLIVIALKLNSYNPIMDNYNHAKLSTKLTMPNINLRKEANEEIVVNNESDNNLLEPLVNVDEIVLAQTQLYVPPRVEVFNGMTQEELAAQTKSISWDGLPLSRSRGSIYGPSGKETYYDLPMCGVIRGMRARGFSSDQYAYWIREDGVKMFGNYIMCAANLQLHPYGTLVESSLGTCMVVDTGSFASGNPTQLDIATDWTNNNQDTYDCGA